MILVYNEVAEAYCEETRNLGFRASQPVNAVAAQAIMEEVCPSYNGFDAKFLGLFPDDCEIFLAREGSVCIYVRPGKKKLPTQKELHADEYSAMTKDTFGDKYHSPTEFTSRPGMDVKANHGGYKDEIRIWWD